MTDVEQLPPWLSMAQVAEHLGVSLETVRRLVRAGRLIANRIGVGGRIIRVSRDELAAYLEAVTA